MLNNHIVKTSEWTILAGISFVACLSFFFVAGPCCYAGDAGEAIDYQRQIKPLLAQHCYACHGPDREGQDNDLRLDRRDDALVSAIVPGEPEDSSLLERIHTEDPDLRMPPPETKKPQLSATEIALLREWIAQGAPFEEHWSHRPPEHVLPQSKDRPWIRGPVDDFIADYQERKSIAPAVAADRRTLIRRLSLDLIGLPPTEQEVTAFLEDTAPGAYQRVVDRLLASPHFGERMAIYWLDLVRYADTGGYHGDNDRNHAPYRDYVVAAFNENITYDQFIREQLAGDLLPNATQRQKIASGFNRLNMTTREGGAQPKEYMAIYAADRVRNMGSIFLGLTLGCCQCHDHKFDPYTIRDFYSMAAFFADIKETLVGIQKPIVLLDQQQTQRVHDLGEVVSAAKTLLAGDSTVWDTAQAAWEQKEKPTVSLDWRQPETVRIESEAKTEFKVLEDGSLLALGERAASDIYRIDVPIPGEGISAVELEVLPDESLPRRGPGRSGNGNFVLSECEIWLGDKQLSFSEAIASHSQGGWEIEKTIDGDVNTGWAIRPKVGERLTAYFSLASPINPGQQGFVQIRMRQLYGSGYLIGRLKLRTTAVEQPLESIKPRLPYKKIYDVLAQTRMQRSKEDERLLRDHFRRTALETASVRKLIQDAEAEKKQIENAARKVLVTMAEKPRVVRVLSRGDWQDESGEIVAPAVPESLGSISVSDGKRPDRLDLARWLADPQNPLTARVFVNRIWKLMFGRGLVQSLGDFGAQGSLPTHPELLDFLALQFIESGWDVKHLLRQIVTTSAYRQSSDTNGDQLAQDPDNLWLARQGRFRLDAELVRDNALALSGLLVPRIGGESVRPYQPEGYLAHLNFPQRTYKHDEGENQYRRGLYTFWQRTFLHPAMALFDAPSREECTVSRPQSNTPLQALLLLNDPTYVEAARALAIRVLTEGGDDDQSRLDYTYRRALARNIEPNESDVLLALVEKHRLHYQQHPDQAEALSLNGLHRTPEGVDSIELAAWTNVARTVLNLHETITRN
jgi:mono/diheme cytochrome c family protein